MPRKKGWKKAEVKKGNRCAEFQVECKYDNGRNKTEEQASLKTENQDIWQVHLAAKNSANNMPSNLLNNLPNSCSETLREECSDIVASRLSAIVPETAIVNTRAESSFTEYFEVSQDAFSMAKSHHRSVLETVSNENTEISRSASQSWNSCQMVFGTFHQNDERFSAESRGFQCTAYALSMLSQTVITETYCSSLLDKILCDGDNLYCLIINILKSQGKFVQPLLSLEEIPNTFKIADSQFIVKKQPIISGILVEDGMDTGLSTLHSALAFAFIESSSGLLTTGAICSALFKKGEVYFFFDSHSHGRNGLSSCDGTSVVISFTSLEDLVAYLYAFYDSLSIDFHMQFDFLPVTMEFYDKAHISGDLSKNLLEAYFKDQNIRQQVCQEKIPKNGSETDAFKKPTKKKSRKSYQKMYKREQRKSFALKKKEFAQKQEYRKKPGVLAREYAQKKEYRQKPGVLARECAQKKECRKKPGVLARECAQKQESNQKPGVLASEYANKKEYRKKPGVLAKECAQRKDHRQKPGVLAKECANKKEYRKKPGVLAKERAQKKEHRQKPGVLAKTYADKKEYRKKPGVLAKECAQKKEFRKKQVF